MIDPNTTVRIKYTDDYEVLTRVSGGVVPRIGETVCITEEDGKGIMRKDWYEVKDVIWTVQDSAERKPDVVEVKVVSIE